MPDVSKGSTKRITADEKSTELAREIAAQRLQQVEFSPVEAQIAFIKELAFANECRESDAFLKNPKEYALKHGILLSPEVIKEITNSVLYDVRLSDSLKSKLGTNAMKDLVDMRNIREWSIQGSSGGSPNAWPAAAAAAAAVVVAVAAVVTMVVTLVRTTGRPMDLVSRPLDMNLLQQLNKQGIIMPGGQAFVAKDVVNIRK